MESLNKAHVQIWDLYTCAHTHTCTHTRTHTYMSSHMYVRQYSTVILSLNSLAQDGSTALLVASNGGSVEVVRMLLVEFNSSLDEVSNVSVYITICISSLK